MSEPPPVRRGVRRLKLYVAGQSAGGQRAFIGRQRLIEAMSGEVEIEVVDILANPEEAERAGILATPTLADEICKPPRRLIGDVSDTAQVIEYFSIVTEPAREGNDDPD